MPSPVTWVLFAGTGFVERLDPQWGRWPVGATHYREDDGDWQEIPAAEKAKTRWPFPGTWSADMMAELERKNKAGGDKAQGVRRKAGGIFEGAKDGDH